MEKDKEDQKKEKEKEKEKEDQKELEAEAFCENTLRTGANLIINKRLIKAFGIEAAIFLEDLVSKKRYFRKRGMLEDDWFYNTQKNREEDTGLTNLKQTKAIALLTKHGILSTKNKGAPPKKYFKIYHSVIVSFLTKI